MRAGIFIQLRPPCREGGEGDLDTEDLVRGRKSKVFVFVVIIRGGDEGNDDEILLPIDMELLGDNAGAECRLTIEVDRDGKLEKSLSSSIVMHFPFKLSRFEIMA
jgi:hypothetical protein